MRYMLVLTDTKSMPFTHAHLLKEQNRSRGAPVLLWSINYLIQFCWHNYSCSHICLILFIILAIHIRSVKCLFLQSRAQEVYRISSAANNTRYPRERLVNNTDTTTRAQFQQSEISSSYNYLKIFIFFLFKRGLPGCPLRGKHLLLKEWRRPIRRWYALYYSMKKLRFLWIWPVLRNMMLIHWGDSKK